MSMFPTISSYANNNSPLMARSGNSTVEPLPNITGSVAELQYWSERSAKAMQAISSAPKKMNPTTPNTYKNAAPVNLPPVADANSDSELYQLKKATLEREMRMKEREEMMRKKWEENNQRLLEAKKEKEAEETRRREEERQRQKDRERKNAEQIEKTDYSRKEDKTGQRMVEQADQQRRQVEYERYIREMERQQQNGESGNRADKEARENEIRKAKELEEQRAKQAEAQRLMQKQKIQALEQDEKELRALKEKYKNQLNKSISDSPPRKAQPQPLAPSLLNTSPRPQPTVASQSPPFILVTPKKSPKTQNNYRNVRSVCSLQQLEPNYKWRGGLAMLHYTVLLVAPPAPRTLPPEVETKPEAKSNLQGLQALLDLAGRSPQSLKGINALNNVYQNLEKPSDYKALNTLILSVSGQMPTAMPALAVLHIAASAPSLSTNKGAIPSHMKALSTILSVASESGPIGRGLLTLQAAISGSGSNSIAFPYHDRLELLWKQTNGPGRGLVALQSAAKGKPSELVGLNIMLRAADDGSKPMGRGLVALRNSANIAPQSTTPQNTNKSVPTNKSTPSGTTVFSQPTAKSTTTDVVTIPQNSPYVALGMLMHVAKTPGSTQQWESINILAQAAVQMGPPPKYNLGNTEFNALSILSNVAGPSKEFRALNALNRAAEEEKLAPSGNKIRMPSLSSYPALQLMSHLADTPGVLKNHRGITLLNQAAKSDPARPKSANRPPVLPEMRHFPAIQTLAFTSKILNENMKGLSVLHKVANEASRPSSARPSVVKGSPAPTAPTGQLPVLMKAANETKGLNGLAALNTLNYSTHGFPSDMPALGVVWNASRDTTGNVNGMGILALRAAALYRAPKPALNLLWQCVDKDKAKYPFRGLKALQKSIESPSAGKSLSKSSPSKPGHISRTESAMTILIQSSQLNRTQVYQGLQTLQRVRKNGVSPTKSSTSELRGLNALLKSSPQGMKGLSALNSINQKSQSSSNGQSSGLNVLFKLASTNGSYSAIKVLEGATHTKDQSRDTAAVDMLVEVSRQMNSNNNFRALYVLEEAMKRS